jgi:hypothetical protein
MPTITATTHDATFGVVSVTKSTSRPYTYAVIRVSDAGDVSASFHMTRQAAEKSAGRPAPGVTRHVVPVEKRGILLDPRNADTPFSLTAVANRNIPECRFDSWGDQYCKCWKCRNPSDLLASTIRPR